MSKTESSSYDDFPDNTDVMWMKIALMAASRAEVSEYAKGKPSVGCVIRRSRNRGPPAVLAVGWNGFLPDTPEKEIAAIQGRSFKEPRAAQERDNALTDELGLHAEVNALQYCSERPEMATIYTTHVPCYRCAKQLVAHKVGRVFYLFWMKGSDSSIELFKKFDITCVPFGRRGEVLEDFNMPVFLEKRKIVEGSTVAQTSTIPNQYFLDSRDNGDKHLKEVENYRWEEIKDLKSKEGEQEETGCHDDFPGNSDIMWMKMALMAASRAEIPGETENMPSVGCVIRRARTRGPTAVLAVGWNGFLPNTPDEELAAIKGRSFKKPNKSQKRDNTLTALLGLHAETNALQYCSEAPEKATVYVTHLPCYNCAKQLVANKVGRVFYLFWMTYPDGESERTMSLFEKFDISCIAFSKRDKVLEDFSPNFLGLRGIVRGCTVDKTPPEGCPSFLDSRDRKQTT